MCCFLQAFYEFSLLKELEKLDCMYFDYLLFIWRNIVGFLDCIFIVMILFNIDLNLGVVYYWFDCDIFISDELRDL